MVSNDKNRSPYDKETSDAMVAADIKNFNKRFYESFDTQYFIQKCLYLPAMMGNPKLINPPLLKGIEIGKLKVSMGQKELYEGAVDFAAPVGTHVLAALDGKVVRVRDDSDRHGETSDFGKDVNYITIEHENDELSEYLHLAKDSAVVKVGDQVEKGQLIASTGLSGWLFAPHLHFHVYKKPTNPDDFQCLAVQFDKD